MHGTPEYRSQIYPRQMYHPHHRAPVIPPSYPSFAYPSYHGGNNIFSQSVVRLFLLTIISYSRSLHSPEAPGAAGPRMHPIHERLWLNQQRIQELHRRRLDARSRHGYVKSSLSRWRCLVICNLYFRFFFNADAFRQVHKYRKYHKFHHYRNPHKYHRCHKSLRSLKYHSMDCIYAAVAAAAVQVLVAALGMARCSLKTISLHRHRLHLYNRPFTVVQKCYRLA